WTPAADRPGWYRWSAGTVPAAKYVIQVEGAGLVKLVDVAGAGDKNVEIVLPDAATLRVRVVASTWQAGPRGASALEAAGRAGDALREPGGLARLRRRARLLRG